MQGKGMGAGRPRKHPHDPAIGQIAIDAEFQELADDKSEYMETRNELIAEYGRDSMNALTYVVDNADGTNSKYVAAVLAIHKISEKADVNDVDTLYACLEEYLQFCIDHNLQITNMNAYAACGLQRNQVKDWALGKARASDPAYKRFAITIRQICSQTREMLAVEGKLNPIIAIWHQKNYDGFSDRPEAFSEGEDESPKLSAAEIASKYAQIGDD